jgi:hypothetical protein
MTTRCVLDQLQQSHDCGALVPSPGKWKTDNKDLWTIGPCSPINVSIWRGWEGRTGVSETGGGVALLGLGLAKKVKRF